MTTFSVCCCSFPLKLLKLSFTHSMILTRVDSGSHIIGRLSFHTGRPLLRFHYRESGMKTTKQCSKWTIDFKKKLCDRLKSRSHLRLRRSIRIIIHRQWASELPFRPQFTLVERVMTFLFHLSEFSFTVNSKVMPLVRLLSPRFLTDHAPLSVMGNVSIHVLTTAV